MLDNSEGETMKDLKSSCYTYTCIFDLEDKIERGRGGEGKRKKEEKKVRNLISNGPERQITHDG